MINGHMAEGQQGYAVLEDVDKATFTRFAQWAYRGNYKAADIDVDTEEAHKKSVDKKAAPRIVSPSTFMRSSPRADLKSSFADKVKHDGTTILDQPTNQNCEKNLTERFLCHARLYVFAEKYDIAALKTLALQQLRATLANFTLYPNRTGDIIALLRYIYNNTNESKKGVEDLRTVMTEYIGYGMDPLIEDEEFGMLLVEEGGDMMKDFLKMVAKRIQLT